MSDILALMFFVWGCVSAIWQGEGAPYPQLFIAAGIWAICANVSRIYDVFRGENFDEEEIE